MTFSDEGLGDWRGPGPEDVASQARNCTPQDAKPGAGVRRDPGPFPERKGRRAAASDPGCAPRVGQSLAASGPGTPSWQKQGP